MRIPKSCARILIKSALKMRIRFFFTCTLSRVIFVPTKNDSAKPGREKKIKLGRWADVWIPTSALSSCPSFFDCNVYETLARKHSTGKKVLVYARLEVIRVMWKKNCYLASCEKILLADYADKEPLFLFRSSHRLGLSHSWIFIVIIRNKQRANIFL